MKGSDVLANNKYFTEEKWEQVNPYNKSLLNDYMMQIKSEGKSSGTMKQYYSNARIFLIYIMEYHNNKALYKLNGKVFRNLSLWAQDNGLSAARINNMLTIGRNLLNFGLDDDDYSDEFEDCKANPSRIKGMQKETVRDIVFLTDEEVMIIYNNLMERELYNQALLCALMYDSASRRNEVYQLKRDDISLDNFICKRVVVGKRGKKYRPIYNKLTQDTYKEYMKTRKDDNESLWVTKGGTPVSYETLYSWVVSWRSILEKETGEYKKFNPHSWRHSCANNLENGTHYICRNLNKKFELSQIQKLMNHSDIGTTQSYLEDKSEDILLEAFGLK